MACSRSEYDDKNLKKNAFSGRRLQLELDRLDNQKGQISKQFRHEKDQLKRQLTEGGEILKLKSLDPSNIRPLSTTDMKKLSPRFARKLSVSNSQLKSPGTLPEIVAPPDNSKVGQLSLVAKNEKQRRFSLPPTVVLQECTEYETARSNTNNNLTVGKLLQRRASANNALQDETDDIAGRINDFFKKLNNDNDNVNSDTNEGEKSSEWSYTERQNTLP